MKTVIICGLLMAAFLANVIWVYEPGSSLFSWHPTFMSAGLLLTVLGTALFGKLGYTWRLTVHWVLGGLGLFAFLAGFAAIYVNKNNYSKPHFVSWHGISGLATVLFLLGQSCGGVLAKYKISVGLDHKLIKKAHRLNGLVSILLMCLTINLVLPFLSTLWLSYACTVLAPVTVTLYRVAPKILGLGQAKKEKKDKSGKTDKVKG